MKDRSHSDNFNGFMKKQLGCEYGYGKWFDVRQHNNESTQYTLANGNIGMNGTDFLRNSS